MPPPSPPTSLYGKSFTLSGKLLTATPPPKWWATGHPYLGPELLTLYSDSMPKNTWIAVIALLLINSAGGFGYFFFSLPERWFWAARSWDQLTMTFLIIELP